MSTGNKLPYHCISSNTPMYFLLKTHDVWGKWHFEMHILCTNEKGRIGGTTFSLLKSDWHIGLHCVMAKQEFIRQPCQGSTALLSFVTLNSSLLFQCEYYKPKGGGNSPHKEEVMKSGAVARFPLLGEVRPALCGELPGRDPHPPPQTGEPKTGHRPSSQTPASRLSALGEVAQPGYTMVLSQTNHRCRNSQCFLSFW